MNVIRRHGPDPSDAEGRSGEPLTPDEWRDAVLESGGGFV